MGNVPNPIAWRANTRIPPGFAAVLESLRFGADPEILRTIDEQQWCATVPICDREHLTLILARVWPDAVPDWLRQRFAANLASNEEHNRRIAEAHAEISDRFARAGVEFVVLKGFTQCPEYAPDLRFRLQYDLDYYLPSASLEPAQEVLRMLGYEPLEEMEHFPTDHLPTMVRKTGWQWRGDMFDPELPVMVEPHFRLWDRETEGFYAPGIENFWPRRLRGVPALDARDALCYNTLHLLRHLLRSSVRTSHVYELAHFLQKRAGDEVFWNSWRETQPAGLRRLATISFRLAEAWFGCARAYSEPLPEPVESWFEEYAAAPIENLFQPNKHELWLHMSLLDSPVEKRRVLRRRLLPLRLPGPVDAVFVPDEQRTSQIRLRSAWRYVAHVAGRSMHHARTLPGVVWHGVRWQMRAGSLPRGEFWLFLGAAALFTLGSFVFVLLYNLYLMDHGFDERFLGFMNGAMTAGSIAGTLPAGIVARRIGLRRTLGACFASVALVSALRAWVSGSEALIGLAFLGGAAFSLWAVSIAPVVAQLTGDRARARGFSIFFATSIAIGIVGGWLGGRLPGWLLATGWSVGNAGAKQAALWIGCALTASALWPGSRLRFAGAPVRVRAVYPFIPFVGRFLAALVVWSFAMGVFQPFFNAYFSRHLNTPVEQIGTVFSIGQLAQVVAMLASPLIFQRLGLVTGIAAMQMAAAIALAALAGVHSAALAGIVYAAFIAFQWMSEPGMYTLLMDRVQPEERSGASALNFLAIFTSQALAAAASGAALTHFGYPSVIAVAAALALIGGLLFRWLLRDFDTASRRLPTPDPDIASP